MKDKLHALFHRTAQRHDEEPTSAPEVASLSPCPSTVDFVQKSTEQAQQQVLAPHDCLTVAFQNRTTSCNVYAYVTGLALTNNFAPMFILADGKTVYFPPNPCKILSPVTKDVAIPLGPPGNTVQVTIPKMAGGRFWFAVNGRLTFFMNPGPAIVEPSVTNPSDPSHDVDWCFSEFTYNDYQLFANVSYVDFVGAHGVSLSLTNSNGQTQTVPGMIPHGFATLADGLKAQALRDGQAWDKLIQHVNGRPLRILSPNNLLVSQPEVWGDYWQPYVDQVWARFKREDFIVNTQAEAGNLCGRVEYDELAFPEAGRFCRPSASDIFSCSTGPFRTGSNPARNAVIPRLAAAFNRTTLLLNPAQFPNGHSPDQYYLNPITNYYSKLIHRVQEDGRGYAFPYDDVTPEGGVDQAGCVNDCNPKLLVVGVIGT
ncbi:uncharacterized protein EI97DRAFT_370366 [Westerdykella ornata]|uniref:GH64 domain-containing protein n=1 Tax=Westerdykella ornata TaxID=318751 RepID=A0A6A6JUR0_WESOR|nr:uncharacterized protein EI97DRAFT_370366 [Westerdykella ornata]KAF2279833.1 hypothetical protein EI97DRAFT_370366 [Westerdykella ornata]